jgi:NTE family protein
MQLRGPSVFDGLSSEDVAAVAARLERRRFPAGSVVIAEGDRRRELYVFESGVADVFVADRDGIERRVNRVEPGSTLGEMSLLTGRPASATVRATTDVVVLALSEAELERIAARHPLVYRNIGAIVSARLAQTDRRSTRSRAGTTTALLDCGAPPGLGHALAGSVAWHTRAPTLLLVVDDEPAPALRELARLDADALDHARRSGDEQPRRAQVAVVPAAGAFAPEALAGTVDDLRQSFDHVLVQVRGDGPPPLQAGHCVCLAPAGGAAGAHAEHTLKAWAGGRNGADPGCTTIPPLTAEDERALAGGLLPTATEAGAALGWAARHVAGLKVGLALGAGSSRGYAHVGVLRALLRAGLPFDYVAGTSVGAAVASMYALGYDLDGIAGGLDRAGAAMFRPTVPVRGVLSVSGLRRVLQELAGDALIEKLPLPLAFVATDIEHRREVVIRRGHVWLGALASCSIPGIYPAQRVGGHLLVDGGVVNPVPSNVAAAMGADTVVAVKIARGTTAPATELQAVAGAGERIPRTLEVILRSIDIMQGKIETDTAAAATIVIAPEFRDSPGTGLRRFRDGRRFVDAGESAAEASLPRLASALPWLRG